MRYLILILLLVSCFEVSTTQNNSPEDIQVQTTSGTNTTTTGFISDGYTSSGGVGTSSGGYTTGGTVTSGSTSGGSTGIGYSTVGHVTTGGSDSLTTTSGGSTSGGSTSGGTTGGTSGTTQGGLTGVTNTNNTVVSTSDKYVKVTFFDDFKGKPSNSSRDNYCYDQQLPQCFWWEGASTYNCQRINSADHPFFPPMRENALAAIKTVYPYWNDSGKTEEEVFQKHAQVFGSNLQGLNKCVWAIYERVNWMATDYNNHWSAKFDPTMVKVHTGGDGYLELKAKHAPTAIPCTHGGDYRTDGKCYVEYSAKPMYPSINYYLVTTGSKPGIYYPKSGNGYCLYFGSEYNGACLLHQVSSTLFKSGVSYQASMIQLYGVYGISYTPTTSGFNCKDNTKYDPLEFGELACPILNGAVTSAKFGNKDAQGFDRGFYQKEGIWEVKLKIPKGKGAFPAAWLMPIKGAWPNSGGEIDIIEARDGADEIYQTYHHGKCFKTSDQSEIIMDPNNPTEFIDSGNCKKLGYATNINIHKGKTSHEKITDQFLGFDNMYTVEWNGNKINWFLNNEATNEVKVGTAVDKLDDPAQPGTTWANPPAHLSQFASNNFPHDPFFFILNHSTYVSEDYLKNNSWPDQSVMIDYVKVMKQCKTQADFCPTGGTFTEGTGCSGSGTTYQSPCFIRGSGYCANGGNKSGENCIIYTATANINNSISYWIETSPEHSGIFYSASSGSCPSGGSLIDGKCRIEQIPNGLLDTNGIKYEVNKSTGQVYYTPIYKNLVNAPDVSGCDWPRKTLGQYNAKPVCKAWPHFSISNSNCDGIKWNGTHCIWSKGSWYRARELK